MGRALSPPSAHHKQHFREAHHTFKRLRRGATCFSTCPPRVEAECLLRLVKAGSETIESVRELIDVPPKQEKFLRRDRDERSLSYRRRVLAEFDRLTGKSQAEVDEAPKRILTSKRDGFSRLLTCLLR
jgi:hypothetical protein